jgi:phosphatidylinositol alpha-mannosyltransferase
VSEAAADYVHSLTDRDIHIIPNGINVEKYQQNVSRKKSSKKTILFVGRLERRKGIMFLLKAFRELVLSDDTIELHIAGAGPDEARLRRYIQDLEIPRTTFHGFVTEKKKIQLMSEATIFCSPAPYGESFGIVLLEAMALGTPIVAGDNPGYSAVMKDRGSLSIINPKDTNSFVRRLQLMIYDEVLRKAWREWALDYVQQYSYEKVVDQYEKLYQSTCKTNESATIE